MYVGQSAVPLSSTTTKSSKKYVCMLSNCMYVCTKKRYVHTVSWYKEMVCTYVPFLCTKKRYAVRTYVPFLGTKKRYIRTYRFFVQRNGTYVPFLYTKMSLIQQISIKTTPTQSQICTTTGHQCTATPHCTCICIESKFYLHKSSTYVRI